MLSRMSSEELTEWQLYSQIEPFGEDRADLRAGVVASTVANSVRDPKQNSTAYVPFDFMPLVEVPEKTQAQVANKVATMFGAPNDGDTGETGG